MNDVWKEIYEGLKGALILMAKIVSYIILGICAGGLLAYLFAMCCK